MNRLYVVYGSLASTGYRWGIFSHEHCFVTTAMVLHSLINVFIFILTKFPAYTAHTVYLKSIICTIFGKCAKLLNATEIQQRLSFCIKIECSHNSWQRAPLHIDQGDLAMAMAMTTRSPNRQEVS